MICTLNELEQKGSDELLRLAGMIIEVVYAREDKKNSKGQIGVVK